MLSRYLGEPVSSLLSTSPFNEWPVERSVEDELDEPTIYYVFRGGLLEVLCDEDERIKSIFMRAERLNGVLLGEIPFDSSRKHVLETFGPAAASGSGSKDRAGEFGAWDRFSRSGYAIHVEYRTDVDAVRQLTLIRGDAVP